MSQSSVIAEAQDYLLNAGNSGAMVNNYTDVLRELGLALPIWTDARTLINFWQYFLRYLNGSSSIDFTSDAKSIGADLYALQEGSGHMIGGSGKFDQVDYVIGVSPSTPPVAPDYTFTAGPIPYEFTVLHLPYAIALPDITTLGIFAPGASFKWAQFSGGQNDDHGNSVLSDVINGVVAYTQPPMGIQWFESGELGATALFVGSFFSPLTVQMPYQLWDSNNNLSNGGLITIHLLVS